MSDCLLISEHASVLLLGPVRELVVLDIEAGIGPVLGVMLLDEVFSFVPSFVSHLELVHRAVGLAMFAEVFHEHGHVFFEC